MPDGGLSKGLALPPCWQELVVGIIDYIRTFTWDKKLEMWIKSSNILGGSGNMPTVISPGGSRQAKGCHSRAGAPDGIAGRRSLWVLQSCTGTALCKRCTATS